MEAGGEWRVAEMPHATASGHGTSRASQSNQLRDICHPWRDFNKAPLLERSAWTWKPTLMRWMSSYCAGLTAAASLIACAARMENTAQRSGAAGN